MYDIWSFTHDQLILVKEYVVGVWDVRKQKLYSDDLCPGQLQSLAEVEGQMECKLCSSGEGGIDGKCMYMYMCGSAHDCGCVVNSSNASCELHVLLVMLKTFLQTKLIVIIIITRRS